MKRRLVCLTLSILMLLTCLLTSCGGEKTLETPTEEVDNSAKTITMWVVTEDETTPQAQKLVNEAFTKVTKAKFKTNVVIKFCTEDEYYQKLEAAIEANQADIELKAKHDKELRVYLRTHKGEKSNEELKVDFYAENPQYVKFQAMEEEVDDEEAVQTEEETVIGDWGIVEIKYPDEKENQVDIFYLSGYDKYMEYYESEWLAPLGEELSTSSKKLTDYISASLLNGVQIDGGVYAIPNNVAIGEYTYMMIEKELFDLYKQKISNVNTVLDLGTFLNDVTNYNADNGKTPDSEGYVVPLASSFEDCMRQLVWYWELKYTDMSVYQNYFDPDTGRNYVLQTKYEVEVEVTDPEDPEKTKVEKQIYYTALVEPDQLYLTDENGNFLDADGNVLDYRYEMDTEGGFLAKNNDDPKYEEEIDYSMYLVDANGNTVTPDNDKRVVIDGETAMDSYGNTKPTYNYSYEKASDFSLLGTLQLDPSTRTRGGINLAFDSLFTKEDYRNVLTKLMSYEYKDFYGEVKEGQRAAVSFVKGDARIKLEYEENGVYVDPETKREYYAIVAAYPEATEEELYGNMFAVYANSNHLSRSMKVVTYLNTNSEFRDLLQYGIEGQHYEREKVIEKNDKGVETTKYVVNLLPGSSEEKYGTYRMQIEKTGNCFIATPTKEMGGADAWVYAKMQNNDSLINPLLGFDFNTMTEDADYGLDIALIDYINTESRNAWNQISTCTTLDDLDYLLNNSTNGFKKIYSPTDVMNNGNNKMYKATKSDYDPSAPLGPDGGDDQKPDTSGSSPYTVYQSWLNQYGYAYVPQSTT